MSLAVEQNVSHSKQHAGIFVPVYRRMLQQRTPRRRPIKVSLRGWFCSALHEDVAVSRADMLHVCLVEFADGYVPKVYFAVWNGFQDARANWKEQYFDEVAETLVVHAYV